MYLLKRIFQDKIESMESQLCAEKKFSDDLTFSKSVLESRISELDSYTNELNKKIETLNAIIAHLNTAVESTAENLQSNVILVFTVFYTLLYVLF